MISLDRFPGNPILKPFSKNIWEKEAVFNGCLAEKNSVFYLLYRAMAPSKKIGNYEISVSSIGLADSHDRITFSNRKQFLKPEKEWEKYGCEDPRVTFLNGKYYIFYTALSEYPLTPQGIKVGLAITRDFKSIDKKCLITPFNAKAMTLFPEKINGKMAAILTANTDMPPSKIALAYFKDDKELCDQNYWDNWYKKLDTHSLVLTRDEKDHVEIGAPPVKTDRGWLLIYSYIKNYFSPHKIFGIEALLLDLKDPRKIIGRSQAPLLIPERDYELYGKVSHIAFPTGTTVNNGYLGVYYGGADTVICLATCNLEELLDSLTSKKKLRRSVPLGPAKFTRFSQNPLIIPDLQHPWESRYALNPGVAELDDKIHILYRAQGEDGVSTFGYAVTADGETITEKSDRPIYVPRIPEEQRLLPEGGSGCEDPRITRLGDTFYVCYTAYNGKEPAHVALTSLSVSDFRQRKWDKWSMPICISPPEEFDKDACLFEEKINGKYAFIHRLNTQIWLDFVDDLSFPEGKYLRGEIILHPRAGFWDDEKIGLGPPPIKTEKGWLLLYHGISSVDKKYRMGAALLWLENPSFVIGRLDYPLLEPEMDYENNGLRPGTVFGNGGVVRGDEYFMYYGAADQYTCGASINIPDLLDQFERKID